MAEIKVEKSSPMWPWILVALLVIGAIIYFLFMNNGNDTGDDGGLVPTEMQDDDRDTAADQAYNNTTVASFVSYIQEQDPQMGLDHEFTNTAFERLIAATKAMADEVNHDIERDLSIAREHAQEITKDPFETTHANHIRMAADKVADALQNLQQAEFPNLDSEANAVKQAAGDIDPAELTLDQRDAVKGYFDQAAELLEKMNN